MSPLLFGALLLAVALTLGSKVAAGGWSEREAHGAGTALGVVPVVARVDRFAAVQYTSTPGALRQNRERLEALVARAAREGARYVILPELGATGPLAAGGTAGGRPGVEPANGPTLRYFRELAKRYRVRLVAPVVEATEDGAGYSVGAVLLDERGEVLDRVQKRILRPNGEDGDAHVGFARIMLETVDDGGRRVGILSGDDLQSGVPRLAIRGADVILVAANWAPEDPVDWVALSRDLSREYNVHLAVANRRPELGGIFSPDGSVVRAGATGAAVVFGTLRTAGAKWGVEASLGLPSVPIPAHQPFSPGVVELGRRLFMDPGLSSTGEVSCATCHVPERYFADGLPRGEGVRGRTTRRNVPSVLNAAFRASLHWDGNPTTIEQQFKYPLVGFAELNLRSHEELLAYVRSRREYVEAFRSEMGLAPEDIGREEVAQALGSYQRALVSGGSAFDRYRYGGEEGALGPAALRGLQLFTGEARCTRCHTIGERHATFEDGRFHRLGIGYSGKRGTYADPGVGTVSKEDYAGMFFTPSLRNVAETAPYMHDGSVATLPDAVRAHYRYPEMDPALQGVSLSQGQVEDLVAFLRSLTGRERYSAQGERLSPTHDPKERQE
jgi:cytochrome c peroxidase